MELTDQAKAIDTACRAYLALVSSPPIDPQARQIKLTETLDLLCVTYNRSIDVEPDTDGVDSTRANWQQRIEAAKASFPDLGHYRVVDPLEGLDQEIGQGWAHDDIADIEIDLAEVILLIEKGRTNDAVWQFRWGYQNHWGEHLHNLRRYLHRLIFWG